ncbi:MAG: peptidoglycan editing factor PgeF [Bacilli bacterium]|nr:peptidoglycan editing factor PgeF [Bacilli bacterium]
MNNVNLNTIKFDSLNRDNIVHFFSCKSFSYLNDNVYEYYNIPKNVRILKVNQIHSNKVINFTKENINEEYEADGLVTKLDNVALITKTADCQSILLYDKDKKIIGNIHAGWKGTLNKIVDNALDIFIKEYESNPKDIIACINPSLLKCCSEFSINEYELFKKDFSDFVELKENNKCNIDLTNINKYLMLLRGVKEENIYISKLCTSCNNNLFHSYRKDNHTKDRNISIIYKKI